MVAVRGDRRRLGVVGTRSLHPRCCVEFSGIVFVYNFVLSFLCVFVVCVCVMCECVRVLP